MERYEMKHIIICPECNSLANLNTHFGAYFCTKCDWFDDTYNKERISELKALSKSR